MSHFDKPGIIFYWIFPCLPGPKGMPMAQARHEKHACLPAGWPGTLAL